MDDEAYDRGTGWPPDLRAWLRDLQVATAFLTRLPIRPEQPAGLAALARAARCFPLVGLGIGLIAGVVYAVAIEALLAPLLAAVMAVTAAILVTGALHEDGLADTVDGFGGGDREAKLRIMRDSRIGTYGVIALILILGAQVAALAALADSGDVAVALMVCHAASRALLVPVMHLEAPARSDGLAASAGRPSSATTLWALGIGAVVALILAGPFDGIVTSVVGAGVAWAIVRLAHRQIGGITGDVLGMVQQATAIAMLLALVALD